MDVNLPENILIIVPHSDDEILLCAGVIYRAVQQQIPVSVAVVTNGDYLCCDESKGSRRLIESLQALQLLGMKEENIYFFGYPDTGMEKEVSFLSKLYEEEDLYRVYPSGRGQSSYGILGGKQDFSFERKGVHACYAKYDFQEDLRALIEFVHPQLVITTSEWDQHGDHRALFYFVRDEIDKIYGNTKDRPALWQGLVHSPAGDDVWPIPGTPGDNFTMPPGLEEQTNLKWRHRIQMPLPEEMRGQTPDNNLKYRAIRMYRSVLKETEEPEVVRYLLAFAKPEEIFWNVDMVLTEDAISK